MTQKNVDIVFLISSVLTLISSYKVISECEKLPILLEVSNAIDNISRQLSLNARQYIITGDTGRLDKYWKIIDMTHGKGSWDLLYQLKWFQDKTQYTLPELYDIMNINPDDRKYLEQAIDESIELTWKEIQSMNWNSGYYDTNGEGRIEFDSMGRNKKFIQFKDKKEPDPKKAIDNLYDQEYLIGKDKIYQLHQYAVKLITDRQYNVIRTWKVIFYMLLIFTFIFVQVNYIRKK